MNSYRELMEKHQQEVNAFPCFFAFSNQQFDEGMKTLGLNPTDTHLIYKAPGGMFYRKADSPRLHELLDRHDRERREAIAADATGDGYIYQMFRAELSNHEFGFTYELDETLDALDLTLEQVKESPAMLHGLRKALKPYHYSL